MGDMVAFRKAVALVDDRGGGDNRTEVVRGRNLDSVRMVVVASY